MEGYPMQFLLSALMKIASKGSKMSATQKKGRLLLLIRGGGHTKKGMSNFIFSPPPALLSILLCCHCSVEFTRSRYMISAFYLYTQYPVFSKPIQPNQAANQNTGFDSSCQLTKPDT